MNLFAGLGAGKVKFMILNIQADAVMDGQPKKRFPICTIPAKMYLIENGVNCLESLAINLTHLYRLMVKLILMFSFASSCAELEVNLTLQALLGAIVEDLNNEVPAPMHICRFLHFQLSTHLERDPIICSLHSCLIKPP